MKNATALDVKMKTRLWTPNWKKQLWMSNKAKNGSEHWNRGRKSEHQTKKWWWWLWTPILRSDNDDSERRTKMWWWLWTLKLGMWLWMSNEAKHGSECWTKRKMALNAEIGDANRNVKLRSDDDDSECRYWKCDNDGSERQNWKYYSEHQSG